MLDEAPRFTLTHWGKLCMILSKSFYSVQFHLDALSRTELCDENVGFNRAGNFEFFLLVSLRLPDEIRGQDIYR